MLIDNYARWRIHLFVALQCFLMTSATVFAIVTACATSKDFIGPALLVGLIIWSCLPTTISSNVVMTRQAHGNEALTVVETTIGNFIDPFLSPVLVQTYLSLATSGTQPSSPAAPARTTARSTNGYPSSSA